MALWELGEKRVRPRQVVRHGAFRPLYFHYGFARIGGNLLGGVQDEIRGSNKRLRQISGVVHDTDERQIIPVTNKVLGQRALLAAGDAVSPNPPFFEVRRGDRQDVAIPLSGREALPGMRNVIRGMGS